MMGSLVANQRFFQNLDKEKRQWILQNPKDAIALFCEAVNQKFDDETNIVKAINDIFIKNKINITSFPIWKTIKLGTGLKTAGDFCKVLEEKSNEVSDWAKDIMNKPAFIVAEEETEIDLVVASGEDLGFNKAVPRKEIFERAAKHDLYPVPAELGPQLRAQYQDQPKGEYLLIAMEPIEDSDGDLDIFRVIHDDDGLWLNTDYDDPDYSWGPDSRWVFALRK